MRRTRLIAVLAGLMVLAVLSADASAMLHPALGRFLQRDPVIAAVVHTATGGTGPAVPSARRDAYHGRTNAYQYCTSDPVMAADPLGLEDYRIGNGPRPTIRWDDGYPYNPNAEPTWLDYWNWTKYGALLEAAEALGHLPDGTRAYRHYRDATGTDLGIDYNRAIRQDAAIGSGFSAELSGAQADIEREHDGVTTQFSVYSTTARQVSSATENWQKALGGHRIWGAGDVTFDRVTCEYTLRISVDIEDFYNFNKGEADIATGLPDDQNGRFEVFGWAKSFYSRGHVARTVTWKRGQAGKTTKIKGPARR